jgi:hypothetical protein
MAHTPEINHTSASSMEMPRKLGHVISWIAAVLGAARLFLRRAEVAQASRCKLEAVAAEVVRDNGLDPSDATGIAAVQPDLPFFMQSGFGQR